MEQKRLTLSLRGEEVPFSPIRKLTPLADDARRRGIRIHHLNIGQPDIRTPQPVIDAYRNFDAEVLAYSPSLGIPSLRESIAAYHRHYGHAVEPTDVAVIVGLARSRLSTCLRIAVERPEHFEPAADLSMRVRFVPGNLHQLVRA